MCRVLDAVDCHPDELEGFITSLIIAADQRSDVAVFWGLWNIFAKRVTSAHWLPLLDTRQRDSSDLLSAMFLGITWKEGDRHWQRLDGFAYLMDNFFETLPAKPSVFRYYLHFLDQIGERSLPMAFMVMARRLEIGEAQHILADQTVRFLLERLLRRFVYSKPAELKARVDLRNAVLYLLDELVTAGSEITNR